MCEGMPKAKPALNQAGELVGYLIHCPGCVRSHLIYTEPWTKRWTEPDGTEKEKPGHVWEFNGDVDSPTFSPSLDCNKSKPGSHCHSFIKAGKIQFLFDCFHDLKGRIVDLPSDGW